MPPPPSPAPSSNPQTLDEIVDTIKEYEKMFRKVFTKLTVSQLLQCWLVIVFLSFKKFKNILLKIIFEKLFQPTETRREGKELRKKSNISLGSLLQMETSKFGF